MVGKLIDTQVTEYLLTSGGSVDANNEIVLHGAVVVVHTTHPPCVGVHK